MSQFKSFRFNVPPNQTRQLSSRAQARAEIWIYPSLLEFPHPYLLGYPQFPPSASRMVSEELAQEEVCRLPEIERQQKLGEEVAFRPGAAFAKPEIYEALEERGVKHAIRIPAHENLERDIAELPTRPVGRPSHKPVVFYKGLLYQAASWKTARRNKGWRFGLY